MNPAASGLRQVVEVEEKKKCARAQYNFFESRLERERRERKKERKRDNPPAPVFNLLLLASHTVLFSPSHVSPSLVIQEFVSTRKGSRREYSTLFGVRKKLPSGQGKDIDW